MGPGISDIVARWAADPESGEGGLPSCILDGMAPCQNGSRQNKTPDLSGGSISLFYRVLTKPPIFCFTAIVPISPSQYGETQ